MSEEEQNFGVVNLDGDGMECMDLEDEEELPEKTYFPGDKMEDDEQLVCDDTAYMLYHAAQTGAPCLSFDVLYELSPPSSPCLVSEIQDSLTMFLCAGTQAKQSHANHLVVMHCTNLQPNKQPKERNVDDDMSEEEEDEEEEELEKANLQLRMIAHKGAINRVRSTTVNGTTLAATWSDTSVVNIFDLNKHMTAVSKQKAMSTIEEKPLYSFTGHPFEGFAMDWSNTVQGRLATGDCKKHIHLWNMGEGGTWNVDQRPFVGHTASVEDIQWSPNEENVFVSCSVDKSIRVWDVRSPPHKACMLSAENAHDLDVNVINWNKTEPFIVSGGDEGSIKIWDLRQFQSGESVAVFKHHTAAITSVEWHPTESSVFAACGSDNQLTQWDLAIERDDTSSASEEETKVPPQLLFIHQGQTDIKELHWHKHHSGVVISTAHDGFNIFRSISV